LYEKQQAEKRDNRQQKYLIKSVIKALDILEEMSEQSGEVRIKDLSEKLNMGKSTLHRFLSTLAYKGYIKQVEDKGKYFITLKLFEIGNHILQSQDLHSRSMQVLQELHKKTGETVHLVVLDKGDAVFVNKLDRYKSLVTYSAIGKRAPAYCLASGKVLLSYLPQDELESILKHKEMKQFTKNTITDINLLKEQLSEIRKRGIAFDFEELEPGINCVAASVRNYTGQAVAAVSVSGKITNLNNERLITLAREVSEAAQKISENMGYRSNKHTVDEDYINFFKTINTMKVID
jgi:DNA-binding IclR family transcriptional regulator